MKQFFVALIFLLFCTAAVQAQDVSWRKADGHWERKNSLTVSTRFFGSPAPRSTTICPWCEIGYIWGSSFNHRYKIYGCFDMFTLGASARF